jgi:thymidylate synthase (FAD)
MIKLIWITPEAEKLIGYMARVSNPANQDNENVVGLLKYMIRNEHWSPFEMASACFEINTTRDIGRQILRHRSFSFQEFSQRYEDVSKLPYVPLRECRMQDPNNRQSSYEVEDMRLSVQWESQQRVLRTLATDIYRWALTNGIAKEQARALLPEGLTPSRMYMSGTLRSWLHYCALRSDDATQKEHRLIAQEIGRELAKQVPTIWEAWSAKNETEIS